MERGKGFFMALTAEKEYRFAIYSRKSRFSERGDSIENQVELCKRYIKGHFVDIFEEAQGDDNIYVYEDEGFSGKNTNRPAFRKLMDEAKALGITHVVCYRLDRISRSIGDFAKLIEELHLKGIEFVSIKEQFDTQTPIGRAMMYIASVFSQLERETIAERIRDNMTELAKTGRWLGGVTPTGYNSVRVRDKDGKKVHYRLELNEKEAVIVREIYAVYEEYGTLSMTEKVLRRQGVLSKNGKFLTRETIKAILQNPVYAVAGQPVIDYFKEIGANVYVEPGAYAEGSGLIAYNKTKVPGGAVRRQVPSLPADRIIAPGEHRGIIEACRWTKVQRMLRESSRRSRGAAETLTEQTCGGASRKTGGKVGLLSGALRCPFCGGVMRAKKGSAAGRFYYVCSNKIKTISEGAGCCRASNVNGTALDDLVIKEAAAFLAAACHRLRPSISTTVTKNCIGYYQQRSELSASNRSVADAGGFAIQKLLFALERANSAAACDAILKRIEELYKTGGQNRPLSLSEEKETSSGHVAAGNDTEEIIFNMLKSLDTNQQRNIIYKILHNIKLSQ